MRVLVIGALVAVGALLLASVVVLPNLLDPSGYRAEMAARVEALTGREVRIGGRVDLGLLPRPTLSVTDASLADRPPGEEGGESFTLTVERLDMRVAAWPLLRGELRVLGLRLVRPVLTVDRPPAEPLGLLASGLGADDPARSPAVPSRIVITDGDLIVAGDADRGTPGRHLDRINIDVSMNAADGAGPLVLAGDFFEGGRLFSLAAELGQLDQRRTGGLQLEVAGQGPDGSTTTASYSGLARFGPGGGPELRGELKVEGSDAVSSARLLHALARGPTPEEDGGAPPVPAPGLLGDPFALDGQLELTAVALTLDQLNLRVGADEATGRLALGLAAEPRLDLELRAPRLALTQVPPAALDPAAWPRPPHGLQGVIDVTVNALATARGGEIRRVRLELVLPGDGGVVVERASAILPGAADVGFTGTFGTAGGDRDAPPLLAGSFEAATDNLRALLDWLGLDTSTVPAGRLRTLSFTGDVALTPLLLKVARGELRLDASTLAGSFAVGLGPRRQLAVAGSLDRFNADAYLPELPARPPPGAEGEPAAPGGGGDRPERWLPEAWREAALAFDAAVDLRLEQLTWGEVRFRDAHLRGRLERGTVTLDELAIADVAELRVRAEGVADVRDESVDLTFEAETEAPARTLRLLGRDPPPALAAFAPVRLDGTADGPLNAAAIELNVGAGDLRLGLSGDAGAASDRPAAVRLNVAWQAAHPDLAGLLRRLGLPEVPERALAGPVQLAGALDLTGGEEIEARFAGTVGPMAADGTLAWREAQPRPRLALEIGAEPLVGEFVALLAAASRPGRGNPFSPGSLSRQPLDADALDDLDLTFELTTEDVRYGDRSVGPLSVAAALEGGTLELRRFAARPFGGTLDARGRLQPAADEAGPLALTLDLELDRVDAASVLELFDVPPALQGPTDVRLTAATAGRSAYDLVGGLRGELEVRARDGRLAGIDFAPVRRALSDNGPAAEPTNMARVRRDLLSGDTPFALFGGVFSIERGVLRAADLGAMLDEGGLATVGGTVDLLFWASDLTLELRPEETPDDDRLPTVELRVVGPLGNPQVVPRLDDLSDHLTRAAEEADGGPPPAEDAGAVVAPPREPPAMAPEE